MRRVLSTAAVLVAALPGVASAAPFGELPFRAAGGTATCLRATGYPGEVVHNTKTGAEFLQATAAGLVPVAEVESARDANACPEAAARPNGFGAVAFLSYVGTQSDVGVQVALREPGGPWGALTDVVTLPRRADGHALAVDVSERGDALVAFAGGEPKRWTIRAARRAPGGAFAPAETLFTAGKTASSDMRVAAGVSASGESVVAWAFQPAKGKPRELWAAIAPAGGPFGAPARIGTLQRGASFSLAVGAGGHALLAFPSGDDDLLVAERAPGAGFAPATRVGEAQDRIVVAAAAAVRADGAAIVVWQNALRGDLQGVIRAQPGPFSAPRTYVPPSGLKYPKIILDLFDGFASEDSGEVFTDAPSPDRDGGLPHVQLTADGRALVAVAGVTSRDGIWFTPAQWVTVPLGGGAPESGAQGAELRELGTLAPLVTAEGSAALVWSDNNNDERDGRLHLAVEGAPDGADPVAPEVTIGRPEHSVLAADQDLRFTVRCSAACDVRVQLGSGVLAAGDTVSLTRAGERQVRLYGFYAPLATLKGGPVKLAVRYGAPGARRASAKTVTFHLRRLPDTPLPRVLGATARRTADKIVVTWHTDRDAKPSNFIVYGTATRSDPDDPLASVLADANPARNGRSFTSRLSDPKRAARYVKIMVRAKGATKSKTVTVRIRG